MTQQDTQDTPRVCPRCGSSFGCGANSAKGDCWCRVVKVPPGVLATLARDYDDCLCPSCLQELGSQTQSGRS